MDDKIKLIKYEGDNSVFVWKHPCEDFEIDTQLVVHESQEAIFMLNGQALDLFGAGMYKLNAQTTPRLGKLFKLEARENVSVHCEVYFVNKADLMSVKWGTDSRVTFIEPTYNFPLSIGVSGEMVLRVNDSRKLLIKLVGTEYDLSQNKLVQYFRSLLLTKVKSYVAKTIRENKINIFEIDERMQELSDALAVMLKPNFEDYGIELKRFFVLNISKPEGEMQFEKFKSLYFRQYADVAEAKLRQQVSIIDQQTKAQQTVIESQALATKRAQEGYTYQQERGFDVAQTIAKNDAVAQFTNVGVSASSMSAGIDVAKLMKEAVSNNACSNGAQQAKTMTCVTCGTEIPLITKFCPVCGAKANAACVETTVCPSCGKTVANQKFCSECGVKLTSVCPECGSETHRAKFCPECGRSQ